MEAAAEQERKAAEAAATAAARAAADAARAEERVREAERNRLEQQEKQRLHDAECARVAAAASEAGRPRISAANAADWEPPQLEARGVQMGSASTSLRYGSTTACADSWVATGIPTASY